jgi:hypothetical protein
MRIIVTGGRDYGWKWVAGEKVIDYEARQRLTEVLDRAHREFERRQEAERQSENDTSIRTSDTLSPTDTGWNTSSFGRLSEKFTLIQGGASGADKLAREWGQAKPGVVVGTYYADWKQYGKRAGILRNIEMLKDSRPHAVIAFKGGRGTEHMVSIAEKAGVPVLRTWNMIDD